MQARDEWNKLLLKADAAVVNSYNITEMDTDPQINHRRMIVDVEHPTQGRVRHIGVAIKLPETPAAIRRAAPTPTEHTEDAQQDRGAPAPHLAGPGRTRVGGHPSREPRQARR